MQTLSCTPLAPTASPIAPPVTESETPYFFRVRLKNPGERFGFWLIEMVDPSDNPGRALFRGMLTNRPETAGVFPQNEAAKRRQWIADGMNCPCELEPVTFTDYINAPAARLHARAH